MPTFADEVVITQGSLAERRFVAAYGYQGRVTAAVTFDQAQVAGVLPAPDRAAAPFPPDFRTVDRPAGMRPVPAEFPDRVAADREATVVRHRPRAIERRVQWLYQRH